MLTNKRNTAGTISTIDVFDLERQPLQTEYARDYVSLRKSLGQGWFLPNELVSMVRR